MSIGKTTASIKTIALAAIFITALSLAWCRPVDSAGAKPAPKMGWKLVMKVSYFGRIEWAVSPDGSRLTSPMLAIVCRPPIFDTLLYNTESRKVKTFKKEAGFERIGMMMEGGTSHRLKWKYTPWKKVGEDIVAGRKCVKFRRSMLNPQQDAVRYTAFNEEYWVAPLFDLPYIDQLMAPLARLTSREFKMMKGFGMRRVAIWQVFKRGNPVPEVNDRLVHLDTLSCKNVMIDPAIFEMGNDYTNVKDEGEILFSDEGAMPSRF